jgi:hypothetical protein
MKNMPFGERIHAQVRCEVYNVGNQVLFEQPNSHLTSGAVSQITSLGDDQRVYVGWPSGSAIELPERLPEPHVGPLAPICRCLRDGWRLCL